MKILFILTRSNYIAPTHVRYTINDNWMVIEGKVKVAVVTLSNLSA